MAENNFWTQDIKDLTKLLGKSFQQYKVNGDNVAGHLGMVSVPATVSLILILNNSNMGEVEQRDSLKTLLKLAAEMSTSEAFAENRLTPTTPEEDKVCWNILSDFMSEDSSNRFVNEGSGR